MKKLFLFIGLVFVIFFFLFTSFIYYYPNNKITVFIKEITPISLKSFIRDNLFIIHEKNKKIYDLETFAFNLINEKKNYNLLNKIELIYDNNIINNYYLIKYLLPFNNRAISNKTVAHLDFHQEKILIFTGNGELYYIDANKIFNKSLYLKKIQTNINEIINDLRFFDSNKIFLHSDEISIKDMLVLDNNLYFSYVKEVYENCFNISILKGNINLKKIEFSIFFTFDECLSFKNVVQFNAQQAGGRIISYKEDKLLFSIGEFRKRSIAQDATSFFGKIISIDIKTKQPEIFTFGHRNPQGLFYDKEEDIILSTEHGPAGGDEINIIIYGKNYGWPISSYGEHYDGKIRKEAPLYKSHVQHGFEEPLYYFDPSIGISEIIKIPRKFINNSDNIYLVTSLKDSSIYFAKLNSNYTKILSIDRLEIGERIRDILYYDKKNVFIMILEDKPSIGIFYKKNN